MNTLSVIYHMMRADFLERARRTSFLIILGLSMLAGYIYIPPVDSTTLALALGPWRGVNNSAWIGIVFGILTVILFPLFGYFLVKNTIERDRLSRVGQIVATTPISKPAYILGKWLSNLATLTAMLVVFNLMALVMQLVRAEVLHIDLWALSAPIWLMGFPALALTAAAAIWFESAPPLSGSFGNVIYFIAWLLFMDYVGLPGMFRYNIGTIQPHADVLGLSYPLAALQEIGRQVSPSFHGHFNFGGAEYGGVPQVVVWSGLDWTLPYIGGRVFWLMFAIGLAATASIPFDRFDPARDSESNPRSRMKRFWRSLLPDRRIPNPAPEPGFAAPSKVYLSPITDRVSRSRFGAILLAEFKLMLKGRRWWWYAIAIAVSLLGLIGPPGGRRVVPVLAMLWPVLAWSSLGTRETYHETYKLIYSSAHPLRRQVPAAWLSGVLLGILALVGPGIRMLINGQTEHFSVFLIAVLFIPSLAFALGAWSGSPRLFEVIYLSWWFMGANGVAIFDFMQVHQKVPNPQISAVYAGLTAALFIIGLAGRSRQIR